MPAARDRDGLAGFAGALKATVFQFATLTDVSWQVSGEVILMTLLGGLGTLTGPNKRRPPFIRRRKL